MSDSRVRRLRHLEMIWPKPQCSTCLGRPHRVVTIDPDTDVQMSETMPASGCPTCGRSIFREYHLLVDSGRGT